MLECGTAAQPSAFDDKQEIIMDQMALGKIPACLAGTTQFRVAMLVDISSNNIVELPEGFFASFPNLKALILRDNKLIALSPAVASFKTLRTLRLDNNMLRHLPVTIGELSSLEILSVSSNRLVTIPPTIGQLGKSLRMLNLGNNCIRVLPRELGRLGNLSELDLNGNQITAVPCSVGDLTQLKTFNLEWVNYTSHMPGVAANTHPFVLFREACRRLTGAGKGTCTFLDYVQVESHEKAWLFAYDTSTGFTYLHRAASENHLGILQSLIQVHPNINITDFSSSSALCIAISQGNMEAARCLLDSGADPNVGNSSLGSPLHLAVGRLEVWLVRTLLQRNAKANAGELGTMNTPLHILMAKFHHSPCRAAAIGEMLMNEGAKPNMWNRHGWAPIHIAAKKGQKEAVRWIVRYNERAAKMKDKRLHLFEIDIRSETARFTPLHLAAHSGHYKIVRELVLNGADVFVTNIFRKTPRSVSKGHLALYKYFKKIEDLVIRAQTRVHATSAVHIGGVASRLRPTPSEICLETFADDLAVAPQIAAKVGRERGLLTQAAPARVLDTDAAANIELKAIVTSTTERVRAHPTNPHFLKDKVLRNEEPVYERIAAWNRLLRFPSGRLPSLVMKTVLESLLSINNVQLQLTIVDSMGSSGSYGSIQATLVQLMGRANSLILKQELERTLTNMHAESQRAVIAANTREPWARCHSVGRPSHVKSMHATSEKKQSMFGHKLLHAKGWSPCVGDEL